jgi:ATP-dependent exoDNAse (exonuclease V) beta subunit
MARSEARQRERLWYVACTRARDLLVVPCLPAADSRSWSRIVDLGHRQLPELDTLALGALLRGPLVGLTGHRRGLQPTYRQPRRHPR